MKMKQKLFRRKKREEKLIIFRDVVLLAKVKMAKTEANGTGFEDGGKFSPALLPLPAPIEIIV